MAPSYRPYAAAVEYGDSEVERKKPPGRYWCGLGGSPAEMKRRRRVAGYKAYSVEGKVKACIRGGLRWIKAKCSSAQTTNHY